MANVRYEQLTDVRCEQLSDVRCEQVADVRCVYSRISNRGWCVWKKQSLYV